MAKNKISFNEILEFFNKNKINMLKLFKMLPKNKVNKINKAIKNKNKYLVFVYLNENLKNEYNNKLLKKSFKSIEKKLNISKEDIIVIYFKEINKLFPFVYELVETPLYIFFEKKHKLNKDFELIYIGYETGYII